MVVTRERDAERAHRRGPDYEVDDDADDRVAPQVDVVRAGADEDQHDGHDEHHRDALEDLAAEEHPRRHRRAAVALEQAPLTVGGERDEQTAEPGQHDRVGDDAGREVGGEVDLRALELRRAVLAREHRVEQHEQHDREHDREHHRAHVAEPAPQAERGLAHHERDIAHERHLRRPSSPVSSRKTSSRLGRLTSRPASSTRALLRPARQQVERVLRLFGAQRHRRARRSRGVTPMSCPSARRRRRRAGRTG